MPVLLFVLPLLGEAGEVIGAILSAIAAVKTLVWVGHLILGVLRGHKA
jgi:hypothetical protein